MNYARIAPPMKWKLGKIQLFLFGRLDEAWLEALEPLQHPLVSSPILALTRPKESYALNIEACHKKTWCDLLLWQPEGLAKPTGYWSNWINKAKKAYNRTHGDSVHFISVVLVWDAAFDNQHLTSKLSIGPASNIRQQTAILLAYDRNGRVSAQRHRTDTDDHWSTARNGKDQKGRKNLAYFHL